MVDDAAEVLPPAVWEGVLKVGEFDLRCYVLEDGRRFFNADDVEALFMAPGELTVEDFTEMAKWTKGRTE